MVSLTKLMSATVSAALFNREIRQAILSSLGKTASGSIRTDQAQAQTLIEGALALILMRSMKGSWIAQPAAVSAIAALLVSLMKSKDKDERGEPFSQKERVIDVDDYTVID